MIQIKSEVLAVTSGITARISGVLYCIEYYTPLTKNEHDQIRLTTKRKRGRNGCEHEDGFKRNRTLESDTGERARIGRRAESEKVKWYYMREERTSVREMRKRERERVNKV